ncbi:MAG: flagellar hook-basal body complex protein FliE [Dissulfurimicrobium sp.]|uniref:flagellar hook-basal body complex protein FliE n=1 Tax=Dissulfurimicrobium TaxID=1769732 RepID=UPI001EDA3932|nr:flagellar hook-basal body complex protein FliE [Dissulfurimicrobium hydrothermale]UKL13758.1 flagellar hook-basal body complex protein FliE [Dissulfurimicrobium hydrothermale]
MKISGPAEMSTGGNKGASGIGNGENGTQRRGGFGDILTKAVEGVNSDMVRAQELAELSAAGQPVDTAQVMISAAKADISFNLLVQMRNKIISAYEEVMRMQF